MPARKDLHFPPEDEQRAAQLIPNGEVRVSDSVYGHFAGLGLHAPTTSSSTPEESCSGAAPARAGPAARVVDRAGGVEGGCELVRHPQRALAEPVDRLVPLHAGWLLAHGFFRSGGHPSHSAFTTIE